MFTLLFLYLNLSRLRENSDSNNLMFFRGFSVNVGFTRNVKRFVSAVPIFWAGIEILLSKILNRRVCLRFNSQLFHFLKYSFRLYCIFYEPSIGFIPFGFIIQIKVRINQNSCSLCCFFPFTFFSKFFFEYFFILFK